MVLLKGRICAHEAREPEQAIKRQETSVLWGGWVSRGEMGGQKNERKAMFLDSSTQELPNNVAVGCRVLGKALHTF